MSTPPDANRQAQQVFVGLLGRPLLTPGNDAELYRSVVRHLKSVADSARRLGYRVQVVGRAVRLWRIPVAGAVTAPPVPVDLPSRRVLSLACCMAACCEDTHGGVTLQRLSDLVREVTATSGVSVVGYDPDHHSHRRLLVRAAAVLEQWGVLRRRTHDERLLDDWAEHGSGVGAGYDVDRDALLLFTSPEVLALAFAPAPTDAETYASTRTLRLLRAIVETPVVHYRDLDEGDAELLRATRGLRGADAAALTGGFIEARAEGLVLVLPDDELWPTVVDWPKARAADWAALLMADLAGRAGERDAEGVVTLASDRVEAVVADLMEWRGAFMTKDQREVPGLLRQTAERQLAQLGLLRVTPDDGWELLPAAGRYRDPDVVVNAAGEVL